MEDWILKAHDVCFSYGRRRVLRGIDVRIPRGAFVSLVGPNGSGKTTLLRLLYGGRACESGCVLFEEEDVARMNLRLRARRFAVVRQREHSRFPFTCLEMVLLGLHPHLSRFGPPGPDAMQEVRALMEETDVWALRDQPVTALSGGELQRVILTRALAQKPRVLFLDEAMSDCDVRVKISLTGYLREKAAREGLTVIAVNHDLASAYRYSDWVIALKDGQAAACGGPHETMTPAFFAQVFGVEAEVVGDKGFFICGNADRGHEETFVSVK